MFLAEYSDLHYDWMALGKTKKKAIDSLVTTLRKYADDKDELFDGFQTYEDFADSEINVYKISDGEAIKLGYDIHYKDGKKI